MIFLENKLEEYKNITQITRDALEMKQYALRELQRKYPNEYKLFELLSKLEALDTKVKNAKSNIWLVCTNQRAQLRAQVLARSHAQTERINSLRFDYNDFKREKQFNESEQFSIHTKNALNESQQILKHAENARFKILKRLQDHDLIRLTDREFKQLLTYEYKLIELRPQLDYDGSILVEIEQIVQQMNHAETALDCAIHDETKLKQLLQYLENKIEEAVNSFIISKELSEDIFPEDMFPENELTDQFNYFSL